MTQVCRFMTLSVVAYGTTLNRLVANWGMTNGEEGYFLLSNSQLCTPKGHCGSIFPFGGKLHLSYSCDPHGRDYCHGTRSPSEDPAMGTVPFFRSPDRCELLFAFEPFVPCTNCRGLYVIGRLSKYGILFSCLLNIPRSSSSLSISKIYSFPMVQKPPLPVTKNVYSTPCSGSPQRGRHGCARRVVCSRV